MKISPAYRIPLDPEHAQWVAYFTVIWAQIDYFLGLTVAKLLKVEVGPAEMLMQGMTTGPRLNLFYKLAKEKIADHAIKEDALKFYKNLSSLINSRNHLMHGMWGYSTDHGNRGAVSHSKNPDPIVIADELPDIITRASDETHRIVSIFMRLVGQPWEHDPDNPPSYFFGKAPPPGMEQEV